MATMILIGVTVAALLVAVGLDYLFNFLIFYQGGSLYLLLHTLLPMAGYTLVYCPPLFWLARRIARRYAVEE